MFIDNQSVAIMTCLNELAARYGLAPFEFIAVLEDRPNLDTEHRQYVQMLRFLTPPEDLKIEERFDRMLEAIGITGPDSLELFGTREEILQTLQGALRRAPSPPRR